jgi:PX domain
VSQSIAGHTVYEIVVHLINTDQVWAVYRRYSDLVRLRKVLKAIYADSRRAVIDADAGRISLPVIIAHCKLPKRFHISSSERLKEDRKEACAHFLQLLSEVQPLPPELAEFLGLLRSNRLVMQSDGTYTIASPPGDMALLSPSNGSSAQPFADAAAASAAADSNSSFTDDESGESDEDDLMDTADDSSTAAAAAAAGQQQYAGGGLGITTATPPRGKSRPALDPEALLHEYVGSYMRGVIEPAVRRQVCTQLTLLLEPLSVAACLKYIYMNSHVYSHSASKLGVLAAVVALNACYNNSFIVYDCYRSYSSSSRNTCCSKCELTLLMHTVRLLVCLNRRTTA